ncbi:phage holin [Gordoniibacillus kamchatkensis]|uniref:phage holin n=1 Tax=Gordoniibacillus kamchatkensis TaxID=1590651 RepID=UPI0006969C67|nr:phage holin [Paenibacillus sp. VKM B-2647]
MHDFLQPYLNDVVNAVVGLVAAFIVAAIVKLRTKLNTYIDAHTTSVQRYLLHSVAAEAVAYAGTVFKEQGGEQKLDNALSYVNTHLKPYGISFTEAELRGAVEKAYADYQAKTAGANAPAQVPVTPVAPTQTA